MFPKSIAQRLADPVGEEFRSFPVRNGRRTSLFFGSFASRDSASSGGSAKPIPTMLLPWKQVSEFFVRRVGFPAVRDFGSNEGDIPRTEVPSRVIAANFPSLALVDQIAQYSNAALFECHGSLFIALLIVAL